MGKNRVYLADWDYEDDRVKLLYSDGDIVYVRREDFDRTTISFVNASKEDIIRDFASKVGKE